MLRLNRNHLSLENYTLKIATISQDLFLFLEESQPCFSLCHHTSTHSPPKPWSTAPLQGCSVSECVSKLRIFGHSERANSVTCVRNSIYYTASYISSSQLESPHLTLWTAQAQMKQLQDHTLCPSSSRAKVLSRSSASHKPIKPLSRLRVIVVRLQPYRRNRRSPTCNTHMSRSPHFAQPKPVRRCFARRQGGRNL